MILNLTNHEFIHVSHIKHPEVCDYVLQTRDNLIKAATLVKHLGVPIDKHLSFSKYLTIACPQGNTVKVPYILTEKY